MFICLVLLVVAVLILPATFAVAPAVAAMLDIDSIRPDHVAVTDTPQAAVAVPAACRYATFWHIGNTRHATEALSSSLVDRTLPVGRVQGV